MKDTMTRLQRLQTELYWSSLASRLNLGTRAYTRFVILGMGRTGSNFLATSLRSHPDVLCYGELFNNEQTGKRLDWGIPSHRSRPPVVNLRDNNTETFINTHLFGRKPGRIKAVGFKLFYYHAERPPQAAIWEHLKADDIRIIHLRRNNLLDIYVSLQKAKINGEWSSQSGNKSVNTSAPLNLKPEAVQYAFDQIEGWQNTAAERFPDALEVAYEQLVSNYDAELGRISDYLNLRPFAMQTPLVKQSTKPKSATIENYASLKSHFSGSRWAQYFD